MFIIYTRIYVHSFSMDNKYLLRAYHDLNTWNQSQNKIKIVIHMKHHSCAWEDNNQLEK